MHRTSQEVAAQAILFGTLGFRASLEVTEHPQSAIICSQLLPWLEQLGAEISEFDRDILETPHQKLPRELQTEAYWRGEEATFLGWAVQLFNKPKPRSTDSVDPGLLVSNLRILRHNAGELISRAVFRSRIEIEDFCAFCLAVRHRYQIAGLQPDGQANLNRIHKLRLTQLGLSDASPRLNAKELESVMTGSEPSTRGLYVVRGLTAEWLLGTGDS